jgi:hypothetical protein
MGAAPRHLRLASALALALLLALRSLAPAGFMPAFDHGMLTIVVCPDAGVQPPAAMHHGHDRKALHEHCPYAAASGLAAVAALWTTAVIVGPFAAVLLLGRTVLFVERQGRRNRPPAIGPPLLPA